MYEDVLKRQDVKELIEKYKIENPDVINGRISRDNLTESFREFSSFSTENFGIAPFKTFVFRNYQIVDKNEYETKKECMAKKIMESKTTEKEVKTDYLFAIGWSKQLTTDINSCNFRGVQDKNLASFARDYIGLRAEINKRYLPYNIRTDVLLKGFNYLLGLSRYSDNVPEGVLLQEGFRAALTPEKDPLELVRHDSFTELLKDYRNNKKSKKFKEKFRFFYREYFNLDYLNLANNPKTKADLLKCLEESKTDTKSKMEQLKRNRELFLTHYFYTLPEGKRYETLELMDEVLDELADVSYLDSWNRQIWTRLHLAIFPILTKLERLAVSRGIERAGFRIANHSYKKLENLLLKLDD